MTQSYLGWRWVFWVMMIFAALCWVMILLFMPETFAPVLLMRKAKRLRRLDPEGNKELYAPHETSDGRSEASHTERFYDPPDLGQGAHPGAGHHLPLGRLRYSLRSLRGCARHL